MTDVDAPRDLPDDGPTRLRDLSPDDGSWWGNLIAVVVGAFVLLVIANTAFDAVGDRLPAWAKTVIFYGLWVGPAPLLLRRHRGDWSTWRLIAWSVLIVPWWVPFGAMAAIAYALANI